MKDINIPHINDEATIRQGRKQKRIQKVHNFVRSKTGRTLGAIGILGMLAAGTTGVIAIKHHQDKQKARIEQRDKEEESFRAYCKLFLGASSHVMEKRHEDYIWWTKFELPRAISILAKAGIHLDKNLNVIARNNVVDKTLDYLDKEPVSDEEVKNAKKTIGDWKRDGPSLQQLEEVYQEAARLLQAGKVDEANTLLQHYRGKKE